MGMTILVVGDDQESDIPQMLVQWQEQLSYVVCAVFSYAEATDFLHTNQTDILITSVPIAARDDCLFLQQAMDIQPLLQFIVIGDHTEQTVAVELMGCYAAAYIRHPVHSRELQIHIERCLDKVRIREQLQVERVERQRAERASEDALFSRIAISALLETGLEPLSLEQQLDVALEIIMAIPRLVVLRKGAIFIMDEKTGFLCLVSQKGLPEQLLDWCAHVPIGHCLCGKAGERREILFANHVDDDHETRFEGMVDHGHYCVPVVAKDRLLGVLTLYVPAGRLRHSSEDAFLTTIAATLAIIMEHRQVETELKQAEERLRHLAYHDPLTGLRNRQSFNAAMDKIFLAMPGAVSRRQDDTPLRGAFLAVLDIDHFKKVNDTHGHMIGDEVLVLFARHIRECFREQDLAFRFGGEEFVVLLLDLTTETATTVLERFRQRIGAFSFPQAGNITVSIGVVEIVANELSGNLIEKADKALYHAKTTGRDQVHFYQTLVDSGLLEEVHYGSEDVDLWD